MRQTFLTGFKDSTPITGRTHRETLTVGKIMSVVAVVNSNSSNTSNSNIIHLLHNIITRTKLVDASLLSILVEYLNIIMLI